jgi:tRNA pseudouridine55 synthase
MKTKFTLEDIANGYTLCIDKPLEWTSFDVVNKLKYKFKRHLGKKFKIGHAGTLDPLATGLLIVCTGSQTKQIQYIQDAPKEYTGSIFLGATRPSFDRETEVNHTFPIDHITIDNIKETAETFIGLQQQFPPVFSAIKQEGKPIYLKARKGIEVEVKSREIEIMAFDIEKIDLPIIEWRIACTKGTYIRSIANDFGAKLHIGAYLDSLVRTKIGDNHLNDAWNFEELLSYIDSIIPDENESI